MRQATIADYTPDPDNANAGSERGSYMIEASLQRGGAGRSLLADRNGTIIAGNKTLEEAAQLGFTRVAEVETDGTELVVVRRKDLDLTDAAGDARFLAYADNRASEASMTWDYRQIAADVAAGVDLSPFWIPDELIGRAADAGITIPSVPWAAPGALSPAGAAAPPPAPGVRRHAVSCAPGDVWELGDERLVIGSGMDPEALPAMMSAATGPARGNGIIAGWEKATGRRARRTAQDAPETHQAGDKGPAPPPPPQSPRAAPNAQDGPLS